MQRNLTTGSVFKTIIYFALPYFLSYFLQTLYGMADLFIIGQYNGVEATTAVSIGSQVMHMLTVMIVGLAMGTTVMIGRFVGGRQDKQMRQAVGNSASMFMILSIICTILLLLMVQPIVGIMSTPEAAIPGTVAYLRICFIGIPLITAYNIISSIFRGMGDSKSPMYFIAIACIFNIALDYLFIGYFKMGASGAALGTTLAQTASVIIALTVIIRKKMIPGLCLSDFVPKKTILSQILKVGIPVSLQDGFIQISFIMITIFANQRGLTDAAAVGIVEKMISFFFLVPSSMLSTVSALAAQNIGAGRHDRAGQTLKYAAGIAVSFGAFIVILMQFFAGPAVSLFSDDAEVIRLGSQYMHGYVWDCLLAGIHFSFSGYFCAYGLSGISFLHNSISIICARLPLSYLAATRCPDTLLPMGLAAPTGSALSVIICLIAFSWIRKHPNRLQTAVSDQS